jgi:carbonic anhydrase/acetyltransferase-like protein (isoleucine patch superfamily)
VINTFEGHTPEIGPGSYVHPSADVFGNVKIGAGCWIGPGARVRGDNVEGTEAAGDRLGGQPGRVIC